MTTTNSPSPVEQDILKLKHQHADTWRDKPDWYWLISLLEEVWELAWSLVGLHKGPVDWELMQISAIAANWLEHRRERSNS